MILIEKKSARMGVQIVGRDFFLFYRLLDIYHHSWLDYGHTLTRLII
jgi:hypothetical protein